ncbi:MAG: hypothetical protein ACOYXB_10020 [Bacteroidota bacterium]
MTIISKAISDVRTSFRETSKVFLLWGWILTLASFSNFIILKILHAREAYQLMGIYSFGTWIVFAIAGFIILYFMQRRVKRVKKVYSHLDGYIKSLWTISAVSFILAALICTKMEVLPPPFMLLIGGLATTATGLFIKFRPLIIGGIVFFAGAIASTFVSFEYIALLVGLTVIGGYLVPGYILRSSKE